MKRRIGVSSVVLGALFIFAMFVGVYASPSFAAGPPEINLQIISAEGKSLAVTFTHPVDDPMMDFVKSVEIYVNGKLNSVYTYNRQPSKKSFTYYYYDIPFEKGYVIEVKADDTMGHGGNKATIVVP
jgi:hypothetical protein